MMKRVGNYFGEVTETPSNDEKTVWVYVGPYTQLAAAKNCLCEDEVERKIYIYSTDTFFTATGRTQAYGETIHGFVSYDDARERYTFKATGKHKNLLLEHAPHVRIQTQ